MKRLLSVLFIATLLASCSSDDDSSSAGATIVGAWTLTEANLAIPQDFNNDGTADRNFMDEVPCFEGDLTFTAEGAFTQNFSKVEVQVINDETVYVCNGTITSTGTYELDGNQLTTTTNTTTPEITTTTIDLNGNTLKASFGFDSFGEVELVYHKG